MKLQEMVEGIVGGQYTNKSKLHSCRNQVKIELRIYLIPFGRGFFVFCLPPKNIQIRSMENYNFACCFICRWNLVFHTAGKTVAEGIRE